MKLEVKIKKESDKEIEFEIIGEKTLLNPLKQKLLEYKEVEYAEWEVKHPLTTNPEFYLRVSNGNVKEVLKRAIEDLKKDIESLQKQIDEQ